MRQKLEQALSPTDAFLFRWLAVCDQQGWLDDGVHNRDERVPANRVPASSQMVQPSRQHKDEVSS